MHWIGKAVEEGLVIKVELLSSEHERYDKIMKALDDIYESTELV